MTASSSETALSLLTGAGTLGHSRGRPDAPVVLEVFGNYECLHCRRAWPAIVSMLADAGGTERGDLRLVYRHFARSSDFPHAALAAEAAEAADAQGQYWAMHDLLMTVTQALHEDVLIAAGRELGLDVAALRSALTTHRFRDIVQAQLVEGDARGVRSTPTFYLNGERVADPWDLDAVRHAVRGAVARARLPQQTSGSALAYDAAISE